MESQVGLSEKSTAEQGEAVKAGHAEQMELTKDFGTNFCKNSCVEAIDAKHKDQFQDWQNTLTSYCHQAAILTPATEQQQKEMLEHHLANAEHLAEHQREKHDEDIDKHKQKAEE